MNEIQPLPNSARRSFPWAVRILIGLALLGLVVGGILWWINRPIQPVVLSPQEKSVVEAKIEAMQKPPEKNYEKGSKEITLTERELNGLLNERTNFGKSVSLELASHAIHARVETDLDPDLPLIGGKHLKARARFLVSEVPGEASFVLDDVTVWGISLPNDWLGGMKGHDLFGEIFGGGRGHATGKVPGVEEFKVEDGKLIIRLAE